MTIGEPVSGFGTVSGVPGLPGGFAGRFESRLTDVDGVRLHTVSGGDGPPLLLLHGFPQTHVMWHKVAGRLAERFTVVATDLRGYGDSAKPPTTPDHAPYAKRAMARDQVAVMRQLGFERFAVAGHDRRGRDCLGPVRRGGSGGVRPPPAGQAAGSRLTAQAASAPQTRRAAQVAALLRCPGSA